ncbi:hydroxymethylbilane synthase [Acetivibrio mesophilus]|uniref:Porphobilinogen deaminase n=1 Tax=Acetivibrio mesophilus TaxID=2487273 RepID=A0A4Q0I1M8_9FIRM|nr:hydroxymethylbilane synthase [Acetivibrio mesophilus]RXE58041.1 hydroxymethylbilane synthase [Acetivibrio mesophilus]
MKIRVGSRESRLAVRQSQIVIDSIKKYSPDIEIELITMKTTGDIILDKTLDKIGGKGLFVKELDRALLDEKVDITVHSFKDMPMDIDDRLPIAAVSKREDPRDVLVLPKGVNEIDFSRPIGCSSLRRKIQIEKIYPNSTIQPIRGNVLTRLEKLDSGEYSAIALAYAGLKRLGLEDRIWRVFSTDEIVPAACQGIIAVQARKGFDVSFLANFHDKDSWDISVAERSFIKALNGGCSSPAAAFGVIQEDKIILTGFHVDKSNRIYKLTKAGNRNQGEELGYNLAMEMLKGMDT